MKSHVLKRSVLLGFMLALLSLSACQQRHTYRIGVSQCSDDDWRRKMNEEIEREAMFNQDVSVEIRSANDNNEQQIADIRYFADNDFDIIIASPNEADAITPVIEEVYGRGIPVVIFDRDIHGEQYTAHISADNTALGRAAGAYALALLTARTESPRALEIWGLEGSTPAVDRHRGFFEAFTAGGGCIVAEGHGQWNQPDAEREADSLLALYPDVDLIFAHNDRMAIGASTVACRRGLHPYIIGIDAAPDIGIRAVADSLIDATFLYPTEGQRLIQTAMAILRHEPYDRQIVLPISSAVDRSIADMLLIQNASLRHETEKMKALKFQMDEYWTQHSIQTMLFYAVIVILVLLFITLFLVLKAYWQHKRHQQMLVVQNKLLEEQSRQQKEMNRRLHEATLSKLNFYTNASHDLRTPLTLISEPVAQLAAATNLTPRQQTLIRIAHKNVKILRRLINQILDFRKYEAGKLELHLVEMNLTEAVAEWIESFREATRSRDIKLSLDEPKEPVCLALDAEKMERIFFNLLGNAVKFTPDNGTIHVRYAVEDNALLRIEIADTGRGIPQAELQHIFERFYQVEHVRPQGSGIGLSLVKAFVELHGGSISVESEVGCGTKFSLQMPVRHVAETAAVGQRVFTAEEVTTALSRMDTPLPSEADAAASAEQDHIADGERPQLLVIDDNDDIRLLIAQLLGDTYEVHQAANGREGLAKAARLVPDLIICDVMMPVMDGLECCRRIKEEVSTSHIPVLMLTACSQDEQRLEGYKSGADGYLSKPFDGEMLRTRCRNLIDNRKRVYDLPKSAAPSPTPNDPEDAFYNRFLQLFYERISDPDLNIEQLASAMGLGHSQFYRKIKALTNYTPVELMRRLRLRQGRQLLTTTSKTISEIAYEVGFASPAYFTKCYRAEFGETPTERRDNLGQ